VIKINFKEPTHDPEWNAWREKCDTETNKNKNLFDKSEDFKIKADLYGDDKMKRKYYFNDEFKEPFFKKCAYCESIIANQFPDMEHYRPKKRVKNFDRIIDHPGYYWLAYDWKNLLPSCQICNRRKLWRRESGESATGKANLFPLKDESKRAMSHHDDINLEEPLIINPMNENPEQYFKINTVDGQMSSEFENGQATIKIFGLNERDNVLENRKNTITLTRTWLSDLFKALEDESINEILTLLNKIKERVEGQKGYSFASRSLLKKIIGNNYNEWLDEKLQKYSSSISTG